MSTPFDLPFEEPQPDPDEGDPLRPEPRRVLSVSELTRQIRIRLERHFLDVWVDGELSNCRVWNTGHMYFTLKDEGAQIRGVMFRSSLRSLRFEPRDGLRVVARGRVSVYDPKGEYQIVCEQLEPEGLGALQLAFDQLKERLAREGLFDPRRKRPLPLLPRKIGVVTSLDGAAVRDIVNVLQRRHTNAHIVIRPTRVQGEGAALDVARAIAAIDKVPGVDVVIVGRGGGSIEDLWAFNEEVVARALAACRVPTVSAVGHESDVTIADFVADVRAPTPSAAAELVVARTDEFRAQIDRLTQRQAAAASGRLHRAAARLSALEARPAFSAFRVRVAFRGRHADETSHQLRLAMRERLAALERSWQTFHRRLQALDLRRRLSSSRTRLVAGDARLGSSVERRIYGTRVRLGHAAARLDGLSPLAVLGRGYAVCWNEARTAIVRDADAVAQGDRVHVRLQRGELSCTVNGPSQS